MPQTRVQYLCKFLCNRKNKVTEFVFVDESGCEGINHFATVASPLTSYYVFFFLRLKKCENCVRLLGGALRILKIVTIFFCQKYNKITKFVYFFCQKYEKQPSFARKMCKITNFFVQK